MRKRSRKREAILEAIVSDPSHPGAFRLYKKLRRRIPDLSLGTVYRNINVFREEGNVVSVGVVNGEERFDGTVKPHPHFVCEKCGAIIDIPENMQPELHTGFSVETPEFTVDTRKTVFYGICGACSPQ